MELEGDAKDEYVGWSSGRFFHFINTYHVIFSFVRVCDSLNSYESSLDAQHKSFVHHLMVGIRMLSSVVIRTLTKHKSGLKGWNAP